MSGLGAAQVEETERAKKTGAKEKHAKEYPAVVFSSVRFRHVFFYVFLVFCDLLRLLQCFSFTFVLLFRILYIVCNQSCIDSGLM